MPAEHRIDPTLVDAVVGALTRSSAAALEASHELLAHYSDTGDTPTQRAVDTLVDHAADALRALTDSLSDISGELSAVPEQAALRRPTRLDAATLRSADTEGFSARPRRRRDR